jgi:hypothetical protein
MSSRVNTSSSLPHAKPCGASLRRTAEGGCSYVVRGGWRRAPFAYVKLEESGRVAQLAEQCPFKAWVDGSSPSALTKYFSDLQTKSLLTSVQFGPTSRQKVSWEDSPRHRFPLRNPPAFPLLPQGLPQRRIGNINASGRASGQMAFHCSRIRFVFASMPTWRLPFFVVFSNNFPSQAES